MPIVLFGHACLFGEAGFSKPFEVAVGVSGYVNHISFSPCLVLVRTHAVIQSDMASVLRQHRHRIHQLADYALVPLGDFRRSGIQDIHHMRNPSIIWGHIRLISVWEYNVIDSLNVL